MKRFDIGVIEGVLGGFKRFVRDMIVGVLVLSSSYSVALIGYIDKCIDRMF